MLFIYSNYALFFSCCNVLQFVELNVLPTQHSRPSQEPENQSARGSRSNAAPPPPFNSMPFNANDLASMFMNIAANSANTYQGQGHHPQERQGEDSNSSSSNEQPEIRIGGNINLNMDQMPQDLTGAFRSVMEMFSGAPPPGSSGQPGQSQDHHHHFNGRPSPN